jgi:hypothetical protein
VHTSAWSLWTAECVSCPWDATGSITGSASVEDATRDHVRDTGHTVAMKAELRYTFQRQETP